MPKCDSTAASEPVDALYRELSQRAHLRGEVSAAPRSLPPPPPLDFTVYREVTCADGQSVKHGVEPSGIALPNQIHDAIVERTRHSPWIHIYDESCWWKPFYGPPLPGAAFYVFYQTIDRAWCVGGGSVMVFSHTGEMLDDGSDGGE